MPIHNRIADFHQDMTDWRRTLHRNPELLFDTHETAAFVAEKLRAFGVDEIVEGVGRSGVVGIIRGKGPGPAVGLRADMDALPIQELRDLPYTSKNPGKMHACGHDGHTTMLLGAARYLAETRNFSGSVALIFQPAEEGGGGGRVMVEEGVLERFDVAEIYALHNWPGLPEGALAFREGPAMAAGDVFDIRVVGRGTHAAQPHNGIDPIMVGVAIAQALQSIAARVIDPLEAVVVSITQFHAGTAHNVIPEEAWLRGTVRTLNDAVRDRAEAQLKTLAETVAVGFGARAEVQYTRGYPVTVNEAAKTEFARAVGREVVGEAMVIPQKAPEMGSEDFSYFLERRPGAYVWVGQGESAALHHPEYDFNDAIAPVGASFLARLVERARPVV